MEQASAKDTPEQAVFRQHCREWLGDYKPCEPPVRWPLTPLEIMTEEQMSYLRSRQKAACDAGLVGCDYPTSMGGGGRTDCQRIANQEMRAARTPYISKLIGLTKNASKERDECL